MSRPPFTPIIAALPKLTPFIGPEALERRRGRPFRARLGANESPFGPSPKARAAMDAAVRENWKYADPENHDLRTAIAAHHRVPIECVVVGEGIDGLLGLTCALFVDPGDAVITTDGAYPTFNFHVLSRAGRLHALPMRELREDLPNLMVTARAETARIVYVSNPNSPMGTWWSAADLQAFIGALPSETLMILDEAYCDTAPPGTVPAIDVSNPQVIRYRTFSKAYGMAGARIGYAIGESSIIEAFDKVRNHYGINRIGQIGARAALLDQPYLVEVAARIARARDRIGRIAAANGLGSIASAASFVAIDCGGDGNLAARVLDNLIDRDVFARKPVAKGIDQFIRVSVGLESELDVFEQELPAALRDAGRPS